MDFPFRQAFRLLSQHVIALVRCLLAYLGLPVRFVLTIQVIAAMTQLFLLFQCLKAGSSI